MAGFRLLASVLLLALLPVSPVTPRAAARANCNPGHPCPTPTPTVTPTPTPTPTPSALQPLGAAGNWTLSFQDEFDGSSPDSAKWSTCMWWGCSGLTGQGGLEHFQPQGVSEAGGLATLTADLQPGGAQCVDGVPGYAWTYTSGLLQSGPGRSDVDPGCAGAAPSTAKFSQLRGFFEARIKPCCVGGGVTSFWAAAADESWPPEWDFEYQGASNQLDLAVHWGADNQQDYTLLQEPAGWADSFHVLGLEWASDHLTWYVDGVPQKTVNTSAAIPTKAMYPTLALDVGSTYTGLPPSLPASAQADYARVWR
jgi:beta-glucanase (GH16 family)